MPKGIGYGSGSKAKVKKVGIVVVPKNEKVRKKVDKEERKKKSDGHRKKKSESSDRGSEKKLKKFQKRTRQEV